MSNAALLDKCAILILITIRINAMNKFYSLLLCMILGSVSLAVSSTTCVYDIDEDTMTYFDCIQEEAAEAFFDRVDARYSETQCYDTC